MEELNAVITYPEEVSDPEVATKAVRRRLTAAYKVRILRRPTDARSRGNWGLCFVERVCIHQVLPAG